ncbi:unnamed protein product [Trifolium pratense]|uniref:Uncharacterized protein n=1 Tax=Trifolium pratense TaxID=57577 RepID=A0ACB0JDA2_TRIPR|nr:unnamed protein product [Trifolium pratense]
MEEDLIAMQWMRKFINALDIVGQARREKISERMKTLQDLVLGCNKKPGLSIIKLGLGELNEWFVFEGIV